MDPLAHTLVGASLSETRLKALSHLATPTLILAANAPDIDIVSMAFGRDFSLGFRRGWTHGALALIVIPLALAGLILLVDWAVSSLRKRQSNARAGPLVFLSFVGVLTHFVLDWLNTYGIRLLMPFDGRWFYGDALFIIDPWVWLLTGAVVVIANTRSRPSQIAWLVLGLVVTALVSGTAAVPPAARFLWIAGVVATVGARAYGSAQAHLPRLAVIGLACAALYMVAMVTSSRLASRQVDEWLAQRDGISFVAMAGPLPANPFVRDIVVVDESHYHFLELSWLRRERIRVAGPSMDRGQAGPIVEAALTAPHIRGVKTWMRFPAYSVESLLDGYRITIQDVRYMRHDGLGLGTAVVELDRDLRVRAPE